MTTIKIENDTLRIGPRGLTVTFQRTLRIPDNGGTSPLPPGLGRFPIRRVDDYADRVPEQWLSKGGVFVPMYQREAMWISFGRRDHRPRAVKVGIGKVCALTGEPWSESLRGSASARGRRKKQDYIVTPPQPWLDGICAGKGLIRQFVAMPLGQGYTVEGQVTGEERYGGLQLKVFEPKPGLFPEPPPRSVRRRAAFGGGGLDAASLGMPAAAPAPQARSKGASMGLAAGGKMKQKIYPDPHGIETWDETNTSRVYIHICNSMQWREITGEAPPETPVTAKTYASHGFPWFDVYDEGAATLPSSSVLDGVASVSQMDEALFGESLQDDDAVPVSTVHKLWAKLHQLVRDGDW